MSSLQGAGVRYGTNDVVSYTQYSKSIRYRGSYSSGVTQAGTMQGSSSDDVSSAGTGIGTGGQGLVTVGFDYWKTWNNLDGYGNIISYWDYVRLQIRNVIKRYNGSYSYVSVYIGNENSGGAHVVSIKYYDMD